MHENEISKIILDLSFKIHTEPGPGLLEKVYEHALVKCLTDAKLGVKQQVGMPVNFQGDKIELGFRLDILVENKVIIEVKSVENIMNVHKKQLLTYLKLGDKRLGLLINFNQSLLKNGITRIVNNLPE